MTDIQNTINPEDVEWIMKWDEKNPDKPPKEFIFVIDKALAHLLLNEVIFTNTHHWEKEWPQRARETTALCVLCNDVFAWACSDAECIGRYEIECLYRLWSHEPEWGGAAWCIFKRKMLPQGPVYEQMEKAGWDINWLMTTTEEEILEKFRKGPTDPE